VVESLLTPKQVAQTLGYDVATIVRRCNSGQIPHIKLGRTYRISQKWLDEQMAKLGLARAPEISPISASEPRGSAQASDPGTEVRISQEDDMGKEKKEEKLKETKVENKPPAFNPKAKKTPKPTPEGKKEKSFWDKGFFED